MNHKPTILVADDSRSFMMYISVLLNRMCYDVIPVENGIEALQLSKKIRPDIILLDADMPKMDGMAALKQLKEDPQTADIPVIMIAVSDVEKARAECMGLGCSGYILKPIQLSELHEALTTCFALKGGNKRKHLRTVYTKKVKIAHAGSVSEHYARNLSVGGAYIMKKDPLPEGMDLILELPLRFDQRITLDSTVIYTRSVYGEALEVAPGMAVAFKSVSSRDSALLHEYIIYSLIRDLPGIKH